MRIATFPHTSSLIGLGLVAAISLAACGKKEESPAANKAAVASEATAGQTPATAASGSVGSSRATLSVELSSPQEQKITRKISANGTISPWQEASISAELPACVRSLPVQVGSRVAAGALLAQLDDDILRAEHQRIQAVLAEAQAALKLAQDTHARNLRLEKEGFVGSQMGEQSATQLATARARRDQAAAAARADALRLAKASIRAPYAGVISAVHAVPGQMAAPGVEMFRLIRAGRLEWRAQVRAEDLINIRAGMPAQLDIGAETQLKATVRALAPSVDARTRAGLVYIDLPAHPAAKAGMYTGGHIAVGESVALLIAQTALVLRDGFSFVMKVDAAHRVHQTAITTGAQTAGGMIEVQSGLVTSDRIITTGGAFVADGDLVTVLNKSSAETTATSAAAIDTP